MLLEIRNLDVFYGAVRAVKGVSLDISKGEIVAVIGPNGAGKTTLLNVISGVVSHHSGRITFEGQAINHLKPEKVVALGISHVPEGRRVFASMTVTENLLLGAFSRRRRASKSELQGDLEEMWALFPILQERRDQLAGALSGGEQQMLALARGMMAKPKLLMVDEPCLGLAPLIVEAMVTTISQLQARGQTVLLVEQNARAALQAADRAYVMGLGRIVASGDVEEFRGDVEIQETYLGTDNHSPERALNS
jgi:branched-chain amino acid transport system ATP-binding protein